MAMGAMDQGYGGCKGGLEMRETYLTCAENGEKYANKVANKFRAQGKTVTVERGQIPQWGSGIPSAPNYGKTEDGYWIIVEDKR
jgi:hypothetical protein